MKSKFLIAVDRTEQLGSLVKALNSIEWPEGSVSIALNFELTTSDGKLPERIVLIPAGKIIEGRDGRSWKNDDPQRVINFLNARNKELVLDFEHSSELKAPKGEPAPAAAWLSDFALDSDGALTAAVNSWTPAGEKAVTDKEYRYISPVILYDPKTMQIAGISSVGLTNSPNLFVPALNHQHKEKTMELELLLKALGLPSDATFQQAMNAIQKLQGDLQTALNRETTPDLQKFVPRGDYDQLMTRATNAEQQLATINQNNLDTAINSTVDQALKDGKIAPASKDYYVAMCRQDGGLDQFKKFLESAPVIGNPSDLDSKDPTKGQGKALNAEQKEICSALGITEEEFQKAE